MKQLIRTGHLKEHLTVDAAFLRRKFYERAEACGFSRRLGAPEMIRKARAMELPSGILPLPVVQKVLGLTVSSGPLPYPYPSFSDKDMHQVMKLFVEPETSGQTSRRNAFYERVDAILFGDIQAKGGLVTVAGHRVTTVITMDSLKRLAIQEGKVMVAEVKAPWVVLAVGFEEPLMSLENQFQGTIRRIVRGQVSAEVTVELADGTAPCAIVSAKSAQRLSLKEGDAAWAGFSAHAVYSMGTEPNRLCGHQYLLVREPFSFTTRGRAEKGQARTKGQANVPRTHV